jgi:hypothetical protein
MIDHRFKKTTTCCGGENYGRTEIFIYFFCDIEPALAYYANELAASKLAISFLHTIQHILLHYGLHVLAYKPPLIPFVAIITVLHTFIIFSLDKI